MIYTIGDTTGSTYSALDLTTGKAKWSIEHQAGALAPAVDGNYVYFIGECQQQQYTLTGQAGWTHDQGCRGGEPGTATVLGNGRLWVDTAATAAGTAQILESATGLADRTFWSESNPVLVGTTAFLSQYENGVSYDSWFRATDQATGRVLWSKQPTPDTYGEVVQAPIATSKVVYVQMSQGQVIGCDVVSGAQVWSGTTGVTVNPEAGDGYAKFAGSAIGGGVLATELGNRLTIFG